MLQENSFDIQNTKKCYSVFKITIRLSEKNFVCKLVYMLKIQKKSTVQHTVPKIIWFSAWSAFNVLGLVFVPDINIIQVYQRTRSGFFARHKHYTSISTQFLKVWLLCGDSDYFGCSELQSCELQLKVIYCTVVPNKQHVTKKWRKN